MGHSVLFNTLRMNHNNAMMAKTFGCLQQFSKQNLSASVDNSRTMQWRYYSSTKIPLHCSVEPCSGGTIVVQRFHCTV